MRELQAACLLAVLMLIGNSRIYIYRMVHSCSYISWSRDPVEKEKHSQQFILRFRHISRYVVYQAKRRAVVV